MTTQTRIINIEGMTCGGCVQGVVSAVNNLSGIKSLSVDLEGNCATVMFDDAIVGIGSIVEEIEDAGFDTSLV